VVGVVMLGAVAVVFMNLIVDIAYAFLDPRVRYE
jgi:peptide/nickel transport system permease protein